LCWFACVELDLLLPFPKIPSYASQLTASTLSSDVSVNIPAGLFPNLGTGSLVMRFYVIRIIKLGRNPVFFRILLTNSLKLLKREIHVGFASLRVNHVSAISFVHLFSFFAHPLGHYDGAGIPFDRRDK